MGFSVDPAVLARAQMLVGRVADDLVRERRSLDGSVSGLLAGGWSGVAAEQYQRAWEEWRDGADEVLAALHSMGHLLGRTRAAYLASDDDSARTVAPLDERLQERLSCPGSPSTSPSRFTVTYRDHRRPAAVTVTG